MNLSRTIAGVQRLPARLVRRAASLVLRRVRSGPAAGLRFHVDEAGLTYLLGTNERPVQAALARLLAPGHVCYDVGANLGFFTVLAAHLVGAEGRVVAFEPVPRYAAAIRRNAHLNGFDHVTVLEKAVGEVEGRQPLLVTGAVGGSTLASTGQRPDGVEHVVEVEVVALDAVVARGLVPPPDVVKIDVEGAELDVLRGMRETLRRHRPALVYEVDDADPDAFARRRAALDAFVRGCGYAVEHLADAYPGARSRVGHAVALPAPALRPA